MLELGVGSSEVLASFTARCSFLLHQLADTEAQRKQLARVAGQAHERLRLDRRIARLKFLRQMVVAVRP